MGKILLSTWIAVFIFSFSLQAYHGYNYANAQDSTEANDNVSQYNCQEMAMKMEGSLCSKDPRLKEALIRSGELARMEKGKVISVSEDAKRHQETGLLTERELKKIKNVCEQAKLHCDRQCVIEEERYRSMANSAIPNFEVANYYLLQAQGMREANTTCNQAYEKANEKIRTSLGEVASFLAAIASILQALGHNGSDPSDADRGDGNGNDKNDPCKSLGADKDKDVSGLCNKKTNSPATRRRSTASVRPSNAGSITGGTGPGGLINLEDDKPRPGGPRRDNDGGANLASLGGNMGVGPGGLGSGLGSGLGFDSEGSAGGEGSSDGDSDSHGKYMPSGGGGSGGSSGGGGGRRGSGSFGSFATGTKDPLAAKNAKLALNNKLEKLKRNSRNPASLSGRGNSFLDNWEVVSRAYRKNSKNLFHQK